jgi:pyrroline-5-carboxylate reductase
MIGFLGCGHLAQALVLGSIEKKLFAPSQVLISTRTSTTSQKFSKATGVVVAKNNRELILSSEIIFIGIKPFEILPALKELSKENLENKIIISLAAGVGEKVLKKYLGKAQSIYRVMANLGATVQTGVFGIYEVKPNLKDKKIITDFFSSLGEVVFVKKDDEINIITAGSASGIGFVFSFMEEFQNWFEKKGLDRSSARKLTVETFLGASKLAKFSSDMSLSKLRESVTSKKGTTQAGLDAFKKLKVQASLRSGLESAFKRAQLIAKDLLRHAK